MQYTIKSGDTLSKIAAANGTSVSAIMAANPNITNANLIRAGSSISIPSVNPSAPSATSPIPPANMTPAQQAAWNTAVGQIPQQQPAANNGMSTTDVKALQDSLVKMGLMTQAEVNTGYGIYGPKTTAAVSKLNSMKVQMEADIVKEANNNPVLNPPNPTTGEQTPKYKNYTEALAAAGGDVTKMTNQFGQPFSDADQAEALAKATAAEQGYFLDQKAKEEADVASKLASNLGAYDTYTKTAAENFAADKAALDQKAADTGVLFSGGRAQKEKNLQSSYETDQASKLATLGTSVGDTARDYQYKYGNEAANNLSKYYSAGGNTYNANVASGGVGSKGLSAIYNPSANTFQGTEVNKAKASAQTRAAGILWNKGNKLLSTGYNNQYT